MALPLRYPWLSSARGLFGGAEGVGRAPGVGFVEDMMWLDILFLDQAYRSIVLYEDHL